MDAFPRPLTLLTSQPPVWKPEAQAMLASDAAREILAGPRSQSLDAAPMMKTKSGRPFAMLRRSHSDLAQSLAMEEGRDALMETVEEDSPFLNVEEKEPPKSARKGPQVETIFGMDKRPFYPLALFLSTFLGAVCMLNVQSSILDEMLGGAGWFGVVFGWLYFVTLGCMAYAALCDPGQISSQWQQGDQLPRRAHKTWLYKRPVLRFDHYCRWLTNVIGLRNHREFMIMVGGLTLISLLGAVIDVVLFLACVSTSIGFARIWLLVHLAYSVGVGRYASEIFRLHVGFVSRNELAKEWKNDDYYVLPYDDGSSVPVNSLSAEDYDAYADDFEYDSSRNPWDNGWKKNCFNFWWTPRWSPNQMGEF